MAIVAFKTYSTATACLNVTEYVSDGHGLADADRVNRYISDEHSGTQLLGAHRCPADPRLAAIYMGILRRNYERQHFIDPNRKKKCTTHLQLVVSPTREDHVPAEERMVMMQELIDRTVLRDFACIYSPHDNRPDLHIHASICVFSIPDEEGNTYKLGMNNALLYDLRREMDRICVEHGYSIVEAKELWGDKVYREWFLQIREQGVVKIHPPAEKEPIRFQNPRRRSQRYAASKRAQADKEAEQKAFYQKMTRGYRPETADYYYTPTHLYHPKEPEKELHIKRFNDDGKETGELELEAIGLFVWAYVGKKNLASKKISGGQGLYQRLGTLADRATVTRELILELDIRTRAELITHIKECGSDIAELKQEVKRQDTVLSRMAESMMAIDRWEGEQSEEALSWLQEHGCGSAAERERVKKAYIRAEGRKHAAEDLLRQRSGEYRRLKEAEAVLRPSGSREEWEAYLKLLLDQERRKRIGRIREETLIRQIRATGQAIGVASGQLEQILAEVRQAAGEEIVRESDFFMQALRQDSYQRVSAVYQKLRNRCEERHELRTLTDELTVIGPFSFLLVLAVCFFAGMEEIALETEIEELRQEAIAQKEYAKQYRVAKRAALSGAKKMYALEVLLASEEELDACRLRYIEHAARIINRQDMMAEIREGRQTGQLDRVIGDAALRTLQEETAAEKTRWRER